MLAAVWGHVLQSRAFRGREQGDRKQTRNRNASIALCSNGLIIPTHKHGLSVRVCVKGIGRPQIANVYMYLDPFFSEKEIHGML